jgi:hypothetical protein
MSHCDPTTLALVALGEDIPADESAHLESCETCLAEAAELAQVVTLGREAPAELPEVPDHVWAGIQRELALHNAPDGSDRMAVVTTLTPRETPAETAAAVEVPATVVPMVPRRGRLFTVAAVAAAAGAIVGGAVVWTAAESGGTDPGSTGQLVAQAVLDPLAETVSSPGEATVVSSPDGQVVRVDARSLPVNDGFYEVWLLDSDATKLVALGALPAGSIGTFTVPPGLSIEDYPVVDISMESYDGDPSHSKNSLMRGILET